MNRPGQQCYPIISSPMAIGRRVAAFMVAFSIVTANVGEAALAQMLDNTARPVRGQIAISRELAITPSTDKVSLNLREASVQDVLQMLAKQGKFNLLLDSTVTGSLTVDISNVSINKALEYIFNLMDLSYVKDGNTVIVAPKATIDTKNMAVKTLKTIPVQYKSAINIANQLNGTIFKVPRAGGSAQALAAADPDSNSLLIMGTETDIKLVGDALRELDVPRNRKVYHIRHNLPADVANVLAANFFRNNAPVNIAGGSGASSTASASSSSSSSSGSSSNGSSSSGTGSSNGSTSGSSSNGSSGSSSTSSGSSSSSSGSGTPLMGVNVSSFTADGVTFISEPVSSTLTVLGTEEQIALIDSVIDQIDVQRAQVAIEVALVEIQNSDKKSFKPTLPTYRTGSGLLEMSALNGGLNTFTIKNPFSNLKSFSLPKLVASSGSVEIQHSNINQRNRVLANPTMVTIDGQSVSINISDTVASVTYSNTVTNGISQITPTITQQQAGVTVNLTPRIYNDGSVVLTQLTPTVTQPSGVLTIPASGNVPASSVALLSTRSMSLSGVRVKDGETLVIGGLLKESNQMSMNKVPGLDRLPILGAMFRAVNQNDKDKTELVLMVTPHLLKEDNVSYFRNANSGKFSNMNYGRGGIVPVSMPKFTGADPVGGQVQPANSTEQQEDATPVSPPTGSLPHGRDKSASRKHSKSEAIAAKDSQPAQSATTQLAGKTSDAAVANANKPVTRIEITPAGHAPANTENGGVAALMLAKPDSEKTKPGKVAPTPATDAKGTTVYKNPSLTPLWTLDEILK